MIFKNQTFQRLCDDFSRELKFQADEFGGVDEVSLITGIPRSTLRSYTNPTTGINFPAALFPTLPDGLLSNMMRYGSGGKVLVLPSNFNGKLNGSIDDELEEAVEKLGKLFEVKRGGCVAKRDVLKSLIAEFIHLFAKAEAELNQ